MADPSDTTTNIANDIAIFFELIENITHSFDLDAPVEIPLVAPDVLVD